MIISVRPCRYWCYWQFGEATAALAASKRQTNPTHVTAARHWFIPRFPLVRKPAAQFVLRDAVQVGRQLLQAPLGVDGVAAAAATLRRCCPQASVSTVVKPGDPKYALIDLADDWEEEGTKTADCIFLGARGVRGVERFLLGSVSTAVAMNAHCSVEIVHLRRGSAV